MKPFLKLFETRETLVLKYVMTQTGVKIKKIVTEALKKLATRGH